MGKDPRETFLSEMKNNFLLNHMCAARMQKEIDIGCDPLNSCLCQLRKLVRSVDQGSITINLKHPERLIGDFDTMKKASHGALTQKSDERNVSVVSLMQYILDNRELVMELIKLEKMNNNTETLYFFLDLVHYLLKKFPHELHGCIEPQNKRKIEDFDNGKIFMTVLLIVKIALFGVDGADHGNISLKSSLDLQLLLKVSNIISYLAVEITADSVSFQGCVDVACGMTRSVLLAMTGKGKAQNNTKEKEGKERGICSLVQRSAMLESLPSRLFSLLSICMNEALRRHDIECTNSCSAAVRELVISRERESGGLHHMFQFLHTLSGSDDDLIEALITITEVCLRLAAYPTQDTTLAGPWDIYCPVHRDSNTKSEVHNNCLKPSLPILLFIWFIKCSICLDESVLLDLLLSSETRTLEYCFRCTKLLLNTAKTASPSLRSQILLSLQYISNKASALETGASDHEMGPPHTTSRGGGTIVVWRDNSRWDYVARSTWDRHVMLSKNMPPSPSTVCSIDDISDFFTRFGASLQAHANSLRAAETLIKRIEELLEAII